MTAPLNTPRTPPYKLAGVVMLVIAVVIGARVYLQVRGDFLSRTQLTVMADRAGLSMNSGDKVTYNGVEIGRGASIQEVSQGGVPKGKFTLDVDPKYIKLIPENVVAQIKATTVFGNKYVSFTSPPDPKAARVSPSTPISVTSGPGGVTTEFNTLFQTVVSISEKVDPVKLNETLAAPAQALDGLGDRFGQSIVHGNEILSDLNPKMPQIRYDTQRLADLADTYPDSSPDLGADPERRAVECRRGADGLGRLRQHRRRRLRARRPVPGPRRRRPDPLLAAAERIQPRASLHHPQLPRPRAR